MAGLLLTLKGSAASPAMHAGILLHAYTCRIIAVRQSTTSTDAARHSPFLRNPTFAMYNYSCIVCIPVHARARCFLAVSSWGPCLADDKARIRSSPRGMISFWDTITFGRLLLFIDFLFNGLMFGPS